MLLGTYAVLIAGAVSFVAIRLFDPHFFTPWFAVATALAMLVQFVAVIKAIRLLAREPRYRSPVNIGFTVAGVAPIASVVISAMLFGVKFHM